MFRYRSMASRVPQQISLLDWPKVARARSLRRFRRADPQAVSGPQAEAPLAKGAAFACY